MAKGPSESRGSNIPSAQQILDQIKNIHDPKVVEQATRDLLKRYQELGSSGMLPSLVPIEKERKLIREAIKIIKEGDKNIYRKSLKVLRRALALLGENTREQVGATLDIPEMQMESRKSGLDADELFSGLEEETDTPPSFIPSAQEESNGEETIPTTGEIDQLSQDLETMRKESHNEEKEKRALLKRLDLKLYKTVKSLFDVLDFDAEKIEEEGLRTILEDMQAKVQETIKLIDRDELRKLSQKPYLEIKKEMEKHGKGLKALWEDMKEILEEEGLLDILKAGIKKPAQDKTNKAIEINDRDMEEVQPEAGASSQIPTPPRPAPSRIPAAPKLSQAPSDEEMVQLMENDETIRGLLDKLEIIRKGFGEVENYRQTGTPPEGFKDDINIFNDIFDKRNDKLDPLITSESRNVLAARYIDLLKEHMETLFENWDQSVFLTEMTKRLKRVYINNKKLLK